MLVNRPVLVLTVPNADPPVVALPPAAYSTPPGPKPSAFRKMPFEPIVVGAPFARLMLYRFVLPLASGPMANIWLLPLMAISVITWPMLPIRVATPVAGLMLYKLLLFA